MNDSFVFSGAVECSFCFARFSHKSSLVRHLKKSCNQSNRQSDRRRSCHQCVLKKSKCSLKRPVCSRCALRNLICDYPTVQSEENESTPAELEEDTIPVSGNTTSSAIDISLQGVNSLATLQPEITPLLSERSLFDSLFCDNTTTWDSQPQTLTLCTQNNSSIPESISGNDAETETENPELFRAFSLPFSPPQPPTENAPLALAKHSMELIFRVLRTWPKMLAEEFQIPPIFHQTQISPGNKLPLPLATCITLTKMWSGMCEGTEDLVRRTIIQELGSLVIRDKCENLDETELVAVLQSVVIYAIILISPSTKSSEKLPDHDEIFRKVELLIYHVVRNGLWLQEEREQKRPTWGAWIHVTSKRRVVLSLYLLHWAYSILHGVPCFDCADLGFMPAPAPKLLWQSQTEQEWNARYIQWLGRWSGKLYLQAELGWIQPGAVMNARAEKWLEETDEFGFIMISIVNAADYDPPGLKALAS